MIIGEFGILLAVAALGILLNMRPTVFIGAGITPAAPKGITAAKPKPKGITAAKPKPKPKPKLTSRFNPKTTYRPIRGQQTKQGSQVHQQHARTVAQWTKVSQIPPAVHKKIVDSWIVRARKIALARLAQILNAKKRSGYQTIGYTGGFGGTIAPTVPSVTGAIGANAYSAYEEALGLKPAGEPAVKKKMNATANGAIQDFIDCGKNQTCKDAATLKFDIIIRQNATAVINSFRLNLNNADPTQSQV